MNNAGQHVSENWVYYGYYTIVSLVVVSVLIAFGHFLLKRIRVKRGNGTVSTTFFDDYFPYTRKIKVSTKPMYEEGLHTKMNYQYLIERQTRKLYIVFIAITLFSTSFIFTLYVTSLSEQIAPGEVVLEEYQTTINKIVNIESELEKEQIRIIDELKISKNLIDKLKFRVVEETIDYEDELISNVSERFFSIYYVRYVIVRIFIATVMFLLMRFLIKIYFNIRADRNDLILKEEALSTLFYVIDSIEGKVKKGKDENGDFLEDEDGNFLYEEKRYELLRNKIPDFPLLRLFDPTENKNSCKNTKTSNEILELVSTLSSTMEIQKDIMESMQRMYLDNNNGSKKKNQ